MRDLEFLIAGGVLAIGMFASGVFFGQQNQGGEVNKPSQSQAEIHFEHRADGRKDLGGVYEREGLKISWAGSDPMDSRVRPKDVITATIDRLEAEQKTDLGSDENARAMVLLMQAKSILDGTEQVNEHGPVIQ